MISVHGRLLVKQGGLDCKLVIIDNASRDESVAILRREFPGQLLIANHANVGFGRANNQAVPYLDGPYTLLLNSDAFLSQDTLGKTIDYMNAHPRCGILGVKLIGRDGVLQPSARYFPTPWSLFLSRTGLSRFFKRLRLMDDMNWDHASVRLCDWVPGCFYLIRKEVIDQIGLFDPRYFLYYEEMDHCLAAKRAGWEVVFYPHTSVVHVGGESARSEGQLTPQGRQIESLQIESELLYFRKNCGRVAVWSNVLLTTLADAMNALKNLVRRKWGSGTATNLRHLLVVWDLFRRTSWGTRPTR